MNFCLYECFRTDEKLELLRLREHLLRKRIREVVDAKVDECERRAAKGNALVRGSVVAVIGYTNAGKTSLIKRYNLILHFGVVSLTLKLKRKELFTD